MRISELTRSRTSCIRWLLAWGMPLLLMIVATTGLAADNRKNLFRFRSGLAGSAELRQRDGTRTDVWSPSDFITGTVEIMAVPLNLPTGPEIRWTNADITIPSPIQFAVDHQFRGTSHEIGEGTVEDIVTEEIWQGRTEMSTPVGVAVSVNEAKRTYSIHLTFNIPTSGPDFVRHTTTVNRTSNRPTGAPAIVTKTEFANILRTYRDKPNVLVSEFKLNDLPLPAKAGMLTGSRRIPVPKPADWKGNWDAAWEFSWDIDAKLPPVELIVTSPGYSSWRPTAASGPKAGEPLALRAELKSLDGSRPLLKVKRFEWELINTSREPGIALNFPLSSKDVSPDLKLVAAGDQQDQGPDGQRVVTENQGKYVDTMKVESFDWGGWSTLQVRAIMDDGSVVKGRLGAGPTDILLPRREETSRIADVWKSKQSSARGKDDVDDETTKVGVPNAPGDGFTLYEEYRGFYERGKHIEGDPEKKDFFVLNFVGPGAQAGIDLFEDLSELLVHSRLRPNEMSEQERLMNGNHAEGAHRVAQHGVWIKTMVKRALNFDGAVTVLNKAGVAGRPGLVKGIGIQPPDGDGNFFTKPQNLPARDAVFAYDRTVAHELMHSIGAEHHGEIGWFVVFWFMFADEKLNPVHKSVLRRGTYETDFAFIVDENTGEDLATRAAPKMEGIRQAVKNREWRKYIDAAQAEIDREQRMNPGKEHEHVEDIAQHMLEQDVRFSWNFYLGDEHGAESGDEQCIMRYYFSDLYRKQGDPRTYYLIPPGTDRIGLELCTSPAGTGINADSHRPQSRFGAAAAGCGNCAAQISPNDAVPPRRL